MDTSDCSDNIKEFSIECTCAEEVGDVKEISSLQECGFNCDKNPGHTNFIPVHDLLSSLIIVSFQFFGGSEKVFHHRICFISKITSEDLLHYQVRSDPARLHFLLFIDKQFKIYTRSVSISFLFEKDLRNLSIECVKEIESQRDHNVILCVTREIRLRNIIEKTRMTSVATVFKLYKYLLTEKADSYEGLQNVLLSKIYFIKKLSDRTVRLQVCYVSTSRSDNDVLAAHRGKSDRIHYGTGFVTEKDLTELNNNLSVHGNNKNFLLVTANHVIFDDSEAQRTNIDFFYDDFDGRSILKARGVKVIYSNTDGDYSVVLCVTDDSELCDRLKADFAIHPFKSFSALEQIETYLHKTK